MPDIEYCDWFAGSLKNFSTDFLHSTGSLSQSV